MSKFVFPGYVAYLDRVTGERLRAPYDCPAYLKAVKDRARRQPALGEIGSLLSQALDTRNLTPQREGFRHAVERRDALQVALATADAMLDHFEAELWPELVPVVYTKAGPDIPVKPHEALPQMEPAPEPENQVEPESEPEPESVVADDDDEPKPGTGKRPRARKAK